MELKVVDISTWNKKIDFETLKDNVDGVIIRCGYGSDIKSQDDEWWERNVSECERLGIPYGVYLYSYATSAAMVQSETEHILRLIKGRNLQYPVFIDLEDRSQRPYFNADWFIKMGEQIEAEGFWFGVYANLDWFRNVIGNKLDRFVRWVAQYNSTLDTYGDMWQYTSNGYVKGISGRCDLNICYRDFPAEILAKKNGTTVEKEEKPEEIVITPSGSVMQLATDVLANKYGTGEIRKKSLGNKYDAVQKEVNHRLEASVETLAKEVLAGKYGIESERKNALSSRYDEVQDKVNEILDKKQIVYHKVEPGETLSKIAKFYDTTIQAIADMNGIADPNKIYAGSKLRVK